MDNLNLILSIVASIISIISAGASYIFYRKTVKITMSYSNNKLTAGDNSNQIVGKKNRIK